ncbi:PEGA domain-containing protein [Pseudomonas guariconensis]|uniref:PEGA domain-containing protein n=1 Tax=Pseudomonas guariconensis TaxID=1288410 RepID=UPI0018D7075C|nr:PEGA domain-containing protein [Pseudomonas guariconensis]MBH3360474.1 PEGA domain-containing protein [Pseudomonas guariconensis]
MKVPSLLFICAALGGCASSNMVPVDIVSEPSGAQIDVNGVTVGATPVRVQLACTKRWVGVINAPDGWAYDNAVYEVKAIPMAGAGTVQSKRINSCEIKSPPGRMRFDLAIENYAPTQRVEVSTKTTSSGLDQALRSLKSLRDQGLLTEKEYRDKVDIAIGGR